MKGHDKKKTLGSGEWRAHAHACFALCYILLTQIAAHAADAFFSMDGTGNHEKKNEEGQQLQCCSVKVDPS